MAKFFIKTEALRIRPASRMLQQSGILEAIKISEAEAAVFKDYAYRSFEDALNYFGVGRRLFFGEEYKGYVAFWHRTIPEVNYMTGGKILLETDMPAFTSENRYLIRNGRFMRIEGGELLYVWSFYSCSGEVICKEKVAEALMLERPMVELEDDEVENLKTYLGCNYFNRFFIKI